MRKILGIFLILLPFILLSNVNTYAKSLDFKIFPAILEVESKPGESIDHQIVLNGSGGEVYTLKVYGLNILDEYGRFASSLDEQIAVDWISFSPESFSFEEFEEKRVGININIPEDVSLGDYYLTLALEKFEQQEGTSSVSGALEIPLLITVTDGRLPDMEAKVKNFDSSIFNIFNPIKFSLEVENTGLRKIKSFGKLDITNLISKETYTREFVPQNILANSSRVVMDEYGFYTGKGDISWESPSLFGIYSVKGSIYDMYFEDPNASVLVSTPLSYFVYINIYVLGVVLVIFLILILSIVKTVLKRLDMRRRG